MDVESKPSDEAARKAFALMAAESAARAAEFRRVGERRRSRYRMLFCMACGGVLFYLAAGSAEAQVDIPIRHFEAKLAVLGVLFGYWIERTVFGRPA